MRQNQNKKARIDAVEKFVDPEAPWFILFHGYGADAQDLFSLSSHIETKKPLNWLCPNGVIEVPIGPGWTGRAWWNIRMSELNRDFSDENPVGLTELRTSIYELIKQMKVPWNKIILGGFSQGAMLATDIYMNAPETPRGLVILSGALINKSVWKPLASLRKGEEYFISHGQQDQVLPISGSMKLHQFLLESGMKTSKYRSFNGGHEIPTEVLSHLTAYLNDHL